MRMKHKWGKTENKHSATALHGFVMADRNSKNDITGRVHCGCTGAF